MQNHSDAQLLHQYAAQRSEAAFSEIVARHAGLVYSAALRQLESPDLARDVAQSVFTDLARKAPSLADKLPGDASLAGWLYRSTRFAARDRLRGDRRRQARERQVMEHFDATTESAPEWEQVRPVLDEAMAELSEEDREAVLLRYFEEQDLHAVGTALGVSDDAAQKRVSRALERLRTNLTSRGVTTTAGALSALLVAETVSFAPAGLAATLSTAALAGTTLATAATATKAIAMTTLQKTVIAATLAVAVGAGIYETREASTLRTQVQTLQQQQVPLAEEVQQLTKDHDEAARQLAALRDENERLNRNTAELLRLRGEVSRLQKPTEKESIPTPDSAIMLAAKGSDIPPFTAEGTVLTEVFQRATGPPTARMEEAVTFCYSNDWWRIELRYKSGFHSSIPPQSLEGNTISCEPIPGGVRTLTSHTPALIANAYLPADVEATEFPPPDRQNLLVCWLTLFPKPKLPLLSKTTMRRLVSAGFLKDPQNLGQYGLKYGNGGVFVSELCITNNGIIQVGRQSAGHPTRKLGPPFDQGHFEFEYKVLETTNWGGQPFPTRSVLRTYVSNANGTSRDDVRVAVIESFKVESFRTGEIPKPQIDSSRIVALDNRLPAVPGRGSGSVTYAVTNDSWLAATNPALVQLAEVQKTNAVEIPKLRKEQ